MEYRRLGRTALRVSPICLGTMNFGPLTTEPDSFAIMDRALEHGINFFDTANRYGGPKGPGATEEIVGRWFAQGGGRREKVVLATKVFGPMTEWPNDGGLSARHIRAACDESLRRLQTDHIDLYQMHHIDRAAPWDEVWQAMETLVAAGQGASTSAAATSRAGTSRRRTKPAKARHFLGLVSEQSLYNLASRTIELEVLARVPLLRARRDSVEPARGRHARRQSHERRHRAPQERAAALRAHAPAARTVGEALRRARRGAGRGRARVAVAPKGCDRTDHRAAHAGATRRARRCARVDLTLDDATLATLDEIFPGPGGRAPEAYAW